VRGDLGQSGGRSTPGKDEGIKGVPQPSSPPLSQSGVRPDKEESSMSRSVRTIGEVKLGPTTWRIDSDCGVVKLHSSRDGCMVALNEHDACRLADELGTMLYEAAASVERASMGGER